MKKWAFLLILILAVSAFGIYYFYAYKKTPINGEALIYNAESGRWENVQNIPRINREDITNNKNEDGFTNFSVLRGYFDHYDEEKEEIIVKSLLPFTMGMQFEIANLRIPPNKVIYCAPANIIVPNTGKTVATKSLTYPVKNDETLNIPYERVINFDQFIQKATEETYFFLQLTKDFDKKDTNYIKKFIVIGLCD